MDDLCSPFHCNVCLVLQGNASRVKKPEVSRCQFSKLLTCSGCQLVRYCSPEHQKIDWSLHSSFCRAVSKLKRDQGNVEHPLQINKKCYSGPKNRRELEETILIINYGLQEILNRPLKRYEEELISSPVICNICFKWQKLNIVCPICCCQAYCSKDHLVADAEEHQMFCHLFRLYYCPYKVLPSAAHKTCIGCFRCQKKLDMLQYDLKKLIECLSAVNISTNPFNNAKEYQLFAFAAEFSCITSILYCLQCSTQVMVTNSKEFRVFIVGATVEPLLWFLEIHTKLFFIQQSQYESLELYFIGPELQRDSTQKELNYILNVSI